MIDGETRIMGVVGHPVSHTLSPAIQNAALEHFRMNVRYVAFAVPGNQLKKMAEAVRLLQMPGINVTLPHKERIIPLLDEVSSVATRIGAVNTVVNRNGHLVGENTDYDGFLTTLRGLRAGSMKNALVLGSGGAARAVLAALKDQGFQEIILSSRKFSRAKKTMADLGGKRFGEVVPWERREGVRADLLVNATPLGQRARDPLPASARSVRHARAAIDLVVRPRGTRWIALARSYGVAAEEGSVMLIAQGRESFRLWFGKSPPLHVMQDALRRAGGGGRTE